MQFDNIVFEQLNHQEARVSLMFNGEAVSSKTYPADYVFLNGGVSHTLEIVEELQGMKE